MEVALVLCIGFVCLASFLCGARVGQAVSKGEKVEVPSLNPLEAVRKHEAKKEAQLELDKVNTILHNIDVYDGTSNGQKQVPRG